MAFQYDNYKPLYGALGESQGGAQSMQPNQEKDEPSVLADLLMAIPRGIEGAVQGAYGFADMLAFDILPDYDERLLGRSETIGGGLLEGLVHFGLPFAGVSKGLSAASKALGYSEKLAKAGKVKRGAAIFGKISAADAITSGVFLHESEERLADFLVQVPALRNPLTEYLATDPEDTAAEARFKNILEGFIVGSAIEGAMGLFRAFRKSKSAIANGKSLEEAAIPLTDGMTVSAADDMLQAVLREQFGMNTPQAAATDAMIDRLGLDRSRIFFESAEGTGNARVKFTKEGDAVIQALATPNFSSGVHELAHVARRFLFDLDIDAAARLGIDDETINSAAKWSGAEQRADGSWQWTRDAEEKFARGYEKYLYEGGIDDEKTNGMFAAISRWMRDVYKTLTGSSIDIDISDEMRAVFDRMTDRHPFDPEVKARPFRPSMDEPAYLFQDAETRYPRDGKGRYIGAPNGINTPQAFGALRKRLLQRVVDGDYGRMWYRDSAQGILQMAGGDKERARQIAAVIAELSPQKSVRENLVQATRAVQALDAGVDLEGVEGIARLQEDTIERTVRAMEEAFNKGFKVSAFRDDLIRAIDEEMESDFPTIDVWVMKAFDYKVDSPSPRQRDFIVNIIEDIRDELNAKLKPGDEAWQNDQVQAAMWVATKKLSPKKQDQVTANYNIVDALKDTATWQAIETRPAAAAAHMPEAVYAPVAERIHLHADTLSTLRDSKGVDLVARDLKALQFHDTPAERYFDGEVTPMTGSLLAGARQKEAKHMLNEQGAMRADQYAVAMAILLRQNEFAWHTRYQTTAVTKKGSNGVRLDLDGAATADDMRDFATVGVDMLRSNLGDDVAEQVLRTTQVVPTDEGLHLLRMEDSPLDNTKWQTAMQRVADELYGERITNTGKQRMFMAHVNHRQLDWKRNPNGEDALDYLEETYGQTARREVEDVLRRYDSRVYAAHVSVATKYGWTINERLGTKWRAGTVAEQAAAGGNAAARPEATLIDRPDRGRVGEPDITELPVAAKAVKSGRVPGLAQLVRKFRDGQIGRAEFDAGVQELAPVFPYKKVPKPATQQSLRNALKTNQRKLVGAPRKLAAGHKVGLRIDISAYRKDGTFVVSVHEQAVRKKGELRPQADEDFRAGAIIGYDSVARVNNATFGVVESEAERIAAGKAKSTIAVVKGDYVKTSSAEAKRIADEAISDPAWTQVGMDPERHSYFYDRNTMEPIIAADEVVQIGGLVLAKNAKRGSVEEFLYQVPEPARKAGDIALDNPNFVRWFGNSKVKDDEGTPIVVKHGLAMGELQNDVFDFSRLGEHTRAGSAREGFFFSRGDTYQAYAAQRETPKTRDYVRQAEMLHATFLAGLKHQAERMKLLATDESFKDLPDRAKEIIREYSDEIDYKLESNYQTNIWDPNKSYGNLTADDRYLDKTDLQVGSMDYRPELADTTYDIGGWRHSEETSQAFDRLGDAQYEAYSDDLTWGIHNIVEALKDLAPKVADEQKYQIDRAIKRLDEIKGEADWNYKTTADEFASLEKDFAVNADDYEYAHIAGFISMENPLVFDFGGKEYREKKYYDLLVEAKENGHDGAIFKNTYDGGPLDDIYVIFEQGQFKAVDNHGEWDRSNPNVYHQAAEGSDPYGNPRGQARDPRDVVDLDRVNTRADVKQMFKDVLRVRTSARSVRTLHEGHQAAIDRLVEFSDYLNEPTPHAMIAAIKQGGLSDRIGDVGEELTVMREVLATLQNQQYERVSKLFDKDGGFIGTDIDLAKAERDDLVILQVAEEIGDAKAKLATMLGEQRIRPSGVDVTIPTAKIGAMDAEEILKSAGGRKMATKKLRQRMLAAQQTAPGILVGKKPTRLPMLPEFFMNNILSGPITHAVNNTSALLMSIFMPIERALGSAFTGNGQRAAGHLSELFSTMSHMKRSLDSAARAYSDDAAQLLGDAGVYEMPTQRRAISAAGQLKGSETIAGMALNTLGSVVNLPSRLLMTEDEFWKQLAYSRRMERNIHDIAFRRYSNQAERAKFIEQQTRLVFSDLQQYTRKTLHAQGMRQGRSRGLKDQKLNEFAAKFVADNWDNDVGKAAMDAAREARFATFTQALDKSHGSRGLTAMITGRSMRGEISGITARYSDIVQHHPLLRFITPFLRTPTNLLQFFLDRSFGAVSDGTAAMIRKMRGEALDPEQAADVAGRLATGMTMVGVAAMYASMKDENGLPMLTGAGPADPDERAFFEAQGWMPHSIRIDDKYISYRRFDPFATFLSVVADSVQLGDRQRDLNQTPDFLSNTVIAVMDNLKSKTYLAGLTTLISALDKPKQSFVRATEQLARGFAPFSSFTGQAINPYASDDRYLLEVRGALDSFQRSLPFGNKVFGLEARRDLFGEPIEKARGIGPDFLSPLAYTDVQDDIVNRELAQIGAPFSPPDERIDGLRWDDYDNGKQSAYDRFLELHGLVKINGLTMKDSLKRAIQSPGYQRLSMVGNDELDSPRIAALRRIISKYRARAKAITLQEFADLRHDVQAKQYNRNALSNGALPEQLIPLIKR